jgi:hypothetical protein
MSTVRDLLEEALIEVGVLAENETISGSAASRGLTKLNGIVEQWSTDGCMIYAEAREELTFVAGQAAYTMGPSGSLNTTRPQVITQVGLLDVVSNPTNTLEIPMEIINVQKYSEISIKSTQSTLPYYVYVNDTNPSVTLTFFPIPSNTNKAAIYSLKPLTNFTSVNETVSLPVGYRKALVYNLAVEWAESYGKSVSAMVQKIAVDSKAGIARMNHRTPTATSDTYGLINRNTYNIYRGY